MSDAEQRSEQEPPGKELYDALLEKSPDAAILYSWTQLERAVKDVVIRYGLQDEVRPFRSLYDTFALLVERRIVPGSMARAVQRLRTLRNQVAHGMHTATVGEAVTYVDTARTVIEVLEKLIALEDEGQTGTTNPSRSR